MFGKKKIKEGVVFPCSNCDELINLSIEELFSYRVSSDGECVCHSCYKPASVPVWGKMMIKHLGLWIVEERIKALELQKVEERENL